MIGDPDLLDDVNECNIKICFANGEFVVAERIGIYKGYINDNKI